MACQSDGEGGARQVPPAHALMVPVLEQIGGCDLPCNRLVWGCACACVGKESECERIRMHRADMRWPVTARLLPDKSLLFPGNELRGFWWKAVNAVQAQAIQGKRESQHHRCSGEQKEEEGAANSTHGDWKCGCGCWTANISEHRAGCHRCRSAAKHTRPAPGRCQAQAYGARWLGEAGSGGMAAGAGLHYPFLRITSQRGGGVRRRRPAWPRRTGRCSMARARRQRGRCRSLAGWHCSG